MSQLTGRRVTVMGLGRHGGGVAAARWLACQGARVTVTDLASAGDLQSSLAELSPLKIEKLALGGHQPQDFDGAEIVVVNPAVRPGHPLVEQARVRGAQITSEIELLLERCEARVIGVTGSSGKSTTASMIAAILAADGRTAFLGGNIGRSLLSDLEGMTKRDWVVLELSSFQLAYLSAHARLPEIAVVTNCYPHHIDWHGDFAAYRRAKQKLLVERQSPPVAVLNIHDPELAGWRPLLSQAPLDLTADHRLPPLRLAGSHWRIAARLAATVAEAAGCKRSSIGEALASFAGLEHRLERVDSACGRAIFNDSKSTSPETTIAALAAMNRPTWLIAGGQEQGASFATLAQCIAQHAAGVVVVGEVRNRLASAIKRVTSQVRIATCEQLDDALEWCVENSSSGDAILFSPGCASHDEYIDFAARGDTFKQLVAALCADRARNQLRAARCE